MLFTFFIKVGNYLIQSLDIAIFGPKNNTVANSTPFVKDSLKEFRAFLSKPRNLLIVSHKNPDGDAVGSSLGFQNILIAMGHTVNVAIPDDSPDFLKWLPGHKGIIIYEKKIGRIALVEALKQAEMLICVDFNSTDRLGDMESLILTKSVPSILIDHHPAKAAFTEYSLVDITKGSTSELIYLAVHSLGLNHLITPDAATCLLAGIMTDTVGFKVSCTYPEIFETVADLMRLGGDKDRIQDEVYNKFTADRMRLLGFSLEQRMRILPEFRAAYIALNREDFKKYHHIKGDTEGFVNYPLSIGEVVFSVLFTEQDDHIKLSLRSRGNFPANEFASCYFNGGGHVNAAGGRFFGTMEQAISHFEAGLVKYRSFLQE